MAEEKQKLGTDNRNNKFQKLIKQNNEMKEQIAELEDRQQTNN